VSFVAPSQVEVSCGSFGWVLPPVELLSGAAAGAFMLSVCPEASVDGVLQLPRNTAVINKNRIFIKNAFKYLIGAPNTVPAVLMNSVPEQCSCLAGELQPAGSAFVKRKLFTHVALLQHP